MKVIFVLILVYSGNRASAATMVRVGTFNRYAQCVQQGVAFSKKFYYGYYACVPVNAP